LGGEEWELERFEEKGKSERRWDLKKIMERDREKGREGREGGSGKEE